MEIRVKATRAPQKNPEQLCIEKEEPYTCFSPMGMRKPYLAIAKIKNAS
jgi:hypothetical protein